MDELVPDRTRNTYASLSCESRWQNRDPSKNMHSLILLGGLDLLRSLSRIAVILSNVKRSPAIKKIRITVFSYKSQPFNGTFWFIQFSCLQMDSYHDLSNKQILFSSVFFSHAVRSMLFGAVLWFAIYSPYSVIANPQTYEAMSVYVLMQLILLFWVCQKYELHNAWLVPL